MIEFVELTNFQRHQKRRLDLNHPIVVFTGKSNAGKTCAIRGIRWCALNKPLGDFFIRWGSAFTWVGLGVDGHVVTRKRSKSANVYKLDDDDVPFEDLSRIPDAIASVFKLDDRNFATQHDPAYWLSLTAGKVAKELNDIIDLSVIDETLSNLISELNSSRSTSKVVKSRLADAEAEVSRLSWVPEAEEVYAGLQLNESRIASNASRIDSLTTCVEADRDVRQRLSDASMKASAMESIVSRAGKAREAFRAAKTLRESIESYKKLSNLAESLPILDTLAGRIEDLSARHLKLDTLSEIIQELEAAVEESESCRNAARDAEADLLRRTKGKCPVCGSPMAAEKNQNPKRNIAPRPGTGYGPA